MEINLDKIQQAGIIGDGVLMIYGDGSWSIEDHAEYENIAIARVTGKGLETLAKWMAQ